MRNPIILSLLSAAMLCAGWLGLSGVFLLAAFVPLLFISYSYDSSTRSFWKMAGWTALTFGIWGTATTWWIWYATWIGPVATVFIMIFFFGGIFMLYHWVSKRVPKVLSYVILVSAWISFEYLYLIGQISFPWLNLGNGFANDVKIVQWYDTTGAFGGALWVWICNILIFEMLKTRKRSVVISAFSMILIPTGISLIKYYTYKEEGESITVTVVQPNIDPYEEKYEIPQHEQTARLLRLSAEAPANVDYIVMPETALHENIWENSLETNPIFDPFRILARQRFPQAQFIIGASTYKRYEPGERAPSTARTHMNLDFMYDVYNTVFAVDTSDNIQLYHKNKLVVGVERMPFHSVLKHFERFIVDLGGTTGQLGFDTIPTVFHSPGKIVSGTGICYESIYGEYYSDFVKMGAQIMFVITNDGWWGDTPGYRQHFSFSRLRALETRRSVARSANTGISGFINQRGDVLEKSKWDEEISMTHTLPLNDKITFYTKYGDYIARLSVYIFFLCILYSIGYLVKKRNNLI